MPIFFYAFHSKPQATDKLHIIVQVYHRDPKGPGGQRPDPAVYDYGTTVESECGFKGILIKSDKDAYRDDDFEGMGLKHFREKFGDINKVYFFMVPLLGASMPIAIAEGMIPEDRVCEKCKDSLDANVRRTMTVLTRRDPEEVTTKQDGIDEDDDDDNRLRNMLLSPSSTSCKYCGSSIKWLFYEKYGASRSIDLFTEKEHECDPSEMLTTVDMSNCEHCGKMIRWEPAPELEEGRRPCELYFFPEVEHSCQSKSTI